MRTKLKGDTDFEPTCEPGSQRSYRLGYLDGCERALQLMLDVWPPSLRQHEWRLAYQRCAAHVEALHQWAEGDPGLLCDPPAWEVNP